MLSTASELKENVRFEVEKRREYYEEHDEPYTGHSTGFPQLDEIIEGISECGLYLLAGMPGVGKTSLASRIAFEVAGEIPVVYLSFENRPADLTWRLLSSENSTESRPLHIDRFRAGDVDEKEVDALLNTEPLGSHLQNLHFLDGRDLEGGEASRSELRQVKNLVERQVEAPEGIPEGLPEYLLVIDYLQLWAKRPEATCKTGSSSTRVQIQELASALSELARGPVSRDGNNSSPEGNLAVLAIASQNRQSYRDRGSDAGGGQPSSDALKSLKGSGDLEYIADVAMSLTGPSASEDGAREVVLNVAKNRYGKTGKATFTFRPNISDWTGLDGNGQ